MKIPCLAAIAIAVTSSAVLATDWPTWRFDTGRGASTPEQLPESLHLQWTRDMGALKPAWPEDPRLHFDAAYEPVIAGQLMFVGSSRNDSVSAFDLKTGQRKWRVFADGPVRFAPLVHAGRVYFGADDGALYCVDANSGSLHWRFVAAPRARKAIGSERVISVWPVRGGPLFVDGRIHFTVGVWPFEGTFLYSLDPETGDLAGETALDDSAGAAIQHDVITLNDLTPQGYLTATDDLLIIPQGRSKVATLNRETGAFGSYSYRTHSVTNYHVSASGRWLFHGAVTYDMQSKKQISSATRTPVHSDGMMYAADGDAVVAFELDDIQVVERTDRRGKKSQVPVLAKAWSVVGSKLRSEAADAGSPLVVDLKAGSRLFGHQGASLFAIDLGGDEPEVAWQHRLETPAANMIAANGRLVVTTPDGRLHCFGGERVEPQTLDEVITADIQENVEWRGRVASLLEDENPGDAFCVVLGIGSGGLIWELLASDLRLVVVDPDVEKVTELRHFFDAFGLYGSRVVALTGNPFDIELPPYMAHLVVSESPESFGLSTNPRSVAGLLRILRPYGGRAWFPTVADEHAALAKNVAATNLKQVELTQGNGFSVLSRPGALPGSADWTHEYGDASNTLMSHDTLVRAPLGVLWFGGPAADGSLFYNRHFWGPSMAVIGGRMFLQGEIGMTAVDVYTGRILWQLPLEGEAKYLPGRRGNDFEGNLAGYNFLAAEDAVYLVYGKSCLKLDPQTGEEINSFKLPNPDDDWGRVRVIGDKLIAEVFRDIDKDKSKLPPGKQLLAGSKSCVEILAIDRHSGSKLWSHAAEASFPVLSVGTDHVFAFDGALEGFYKDWRRRGVIPKASDIKYAKAISLETGELEWKQPTDFIGTWMSYSGGQDVVLMSNKSSIAALNGRTGEQLWSQKSEGVGFRGHPESLWDRVIVWNDRILDQRGPGLAWNLKTGKRVPRLNPISGEETPWEFTKSGHHCNYAIASPHLMTFRADTAGFCDIESGNTSRLKGFRSGCRNSLIPANGVLNAPNMAHGCICGYSLFTSLALVHLPDAEVWSYSALKYDAKQSEVKRIGINFGAPGDRQDESGTLWVDYPNRGGTSPSVPVSVTGDSLKYFRRHSALIEGDGVRWIAGSGVEGVTGIQLTLSPDASVSPQLCTVRLHFAEPDATEPAKRVFDVSIQGEKALEGFDIVKESGGPQVSLVREFRDILAGDTLSISLTPVSGRPILSGIEVIVGE